MNRRARKALVFRRLFLAFLALPPLAGLGISVLLDSTDQLAAQTNPAEKLALRFSPRPRQTLIYSLQSRMESEGQSFLGRSLTLSAQADGQIDVFVRQAGADSLFTELSSPGIRIFLQTPGRQDEFTLKNPPDSPVLMTFDKAGRIRDIKNVESLEEQNPLNFSILEVLRNYWPAFPDKPLAAGESWPDHKRIIVPFQGMNLVIDLEIIFTLNAVVPSLEGRLALITVVYTAGLSGERQIEDFLGSFEGLGTGSGSMNFQVDGGYFTEYRLDYVIDGAMVMRKAESKVAEWPFRLSAGASLLLL
ncbi:MAG: hypothetical protein WAU81_02480, partial [Candidatus Aminicenantales bacterium]